MFETGEPGFATVVSVIRVSGLFRISSLVLRVYGAPPRPTVQIGRLPRVARNDMICGFMPLCVPLCSLWPKIFQVRSLVVVRQGVMATKKLCASLIMC